MRTPFAIIAVLLAVLVPVGFLTEDPAGETATTSFAVLAERVERLRGERFREVPRPLRVTAGQAQEEGLAEYDRFVTPARRRADEALYTLLGLLPAGTDLREVQASVFGEQVAGYYEPRTKRLRVVEGAGTANRVLDEMVLAHELTHALDDQAIGLDLERMSRPGDAALAYTGVVEGVATQLMYAYVDRHFDDDVAIGGLLGGALAQTGGDLPPFILASLTFPYLTGDAFVEDLLERAGGRWTLVNLAEGERPPASTEQLLHPRRWIEVDAPQDVRLGGVARALGPRYIRLQAGVFGEWQTSQLLVPAGGRTGARAAAGWGGDAYAVYRRDAGEPCATPCRSRDVLVMRWRWDTARDAQEFARVLPAALEQGLDARSAGAGEWSVGAAAARVTAGPRETTLVLAPSAPLARRVTG